MRRRDLERLVGDLEAEDAFARLDAEKRLREEMQTDFGFRWDAPAESRRTAVARLRAHVEEQRKREKARLAGKKGLASLDLQQLKGMTPAQVEKHLQNLLGKAG
ncbi:MAG: hypothetical protein L6R43_10215, partial [Planctomycetes bacterium]|nr:hypothetical protein [Planctomycetota bacterium]